MATATPAGRMLLKNVRLAFPNLFQDEDGRYSAALIFPPDHPQIPEIKAKMLAVAKEKWKEKGDQQYKALEKGDKLALHDGDTKAQYAGYEGQMFINAAAQTRPTVIDGARAPLTERDGKPYAGCYVNASIEFWGQLPGKGKDGDPIPARINAQLRGVQFLRDGDAFAAGRPADSDEFEEVTEGADADDFA